MSHVAKVKVKIKDLESLKAAAAAIGLEFREGQKTYRWWGHSVGDYPMPQGFTKEDLGHCTHALSIPGNNSAYEIGVCECKDGSGGYELLWDFYGGGKGLTAIVGSGASKLTTEYSLEVTKKELKRRGLRFTTVRENGKVQVRAFK